MQGNTHSSGAAAHGREGGSATPRVQDLSLRRKWPVLVAIVPALPMGQALAWIPLELLDPGFSHALITPSIPGVLVPMFVFVNAARPRGRRHWLVLAATTLASTFAGMLGFYLPMRLVAPVTEPTLFGELPALLIAMIAGVVIAIAVWLFVRRATRAEGLWIGPMVDRAPAR